MRWENYENGAWAVPESGGRLKLGSGAHVSPEAAHKAQIERCRAIANNRYLRYHHWAQVGRACQWLERNGHSV